jgi:glycosyltransferase involved in cell wall biosynthesis
MKENLILSYGISPEKIEVQRHVIPKSDFPMTHNSLQKSKDRIFRFFYPASPYPHKNHQILWSLIPLLEKSPRNVRFDLTIDPGLVPESIRQSKYIRCLGTLSPNDCRRYLTECDSLFFPSKVESYGLPLLEALLFGRIPVLAADRPYAREVCGSLAIYFDPNSPDDLLAKLTMLLGDETILINEKTLKELPALVSWQDMATCMFE